MRTKRKNDDTGTVWMDGDAVVFRLYRTDMVVWRPDRIVVMRHDSRSSAGFADRLLPHSLDAYMRFNEMVINRLHTTNQWVIDKIGDTWVIDPSTLVKHDKMLLDLKVLARMRKRAKPFLEYVHARKTLLNDRDVYRADSRYPQSAVHLLIRRVDDQASFPQLYNVVKSAMELDKISKDLPVMLALSEGGYKKQACEPGHKPDNPYWVSAFSHLISNCET